MTLFIGGYTYAGVRPGVGDNSRGSTTYSGFGGLYRGETNERTNTSSGIQSRSDRFYPHFGGAHHNSRGGGNGDGEGSGGC